MNRQQYAALFQTLQRTRTRYAECVKLTRTDGQVFRFTAHDKDLRIEEPENQGTHTYTPANSFTMSNLETQSGLAVSNMDIDAIVDDDSITEADLANGFFDNAKIELFIAYWSNTNIAILPLRTSWVGEISMSGLAFKADLRGIAQKLAQVFTASTSLECRWSFCDQNEAGKSLCKLDPAPFTSNFTVLSLFGPDMFELAIPEADQEGEYQFGKVTWLTGDNAGISMEVLHQWNTRVKLFLPMKKPIQVGDTLSMIKGCDKTWARCGEFENRCNFGGQPFLAGGDMLTRVPAPGDPTRGGPNQ